jgi:flagellar biosynthesis component FlhA
MTLRELQQAVQQLSMEEQLALLETIVQAIKLKQQPQIDRQILVDQLRGCLKYSGQFIPTDEDITVMREERLVEKYLA